MRVLLVLFLLIPYSCFAGFPEGLMDAAYGRLDANVVYDGSYLSIPYPNGDVPKNIGVCTDVIIRSYRKIGIDLQKLVHEDMRSSFNKYPSKRIWGLNTTDRNIDHRRVPNLQVYFARYGKKLPITSSKNDYKPGDLVTWLLPPNLPHIGIVIDRKSKITGNPLIIHNVGRGPDMEDFLFDYKITGHYRFDPAGLP